MMFRHVSSNLSTHLTFSRKRIIQEIHKLFGYNHKKFIRYVIRHGYGKLNYYHNILHVYEVMQITCELIKHIGHELNKREQFLLKVSALCHDIHHQGYSNKKIESILYTDEIINEAVNELITLSKEGNNSYDNLTNIVTTDSFNEEFHVQKALHTINHFKLLSKENEEKEIFMIKSLILSTSLSMNKKYVNYLEENSPSSNKMSKMILILKLADISHTWSRDFRTHSYWVFKRYEEDNETFKSIEDLSNNTIQFMNMFVEPMMKIVKDCVDSDIYRAMNEKYVSNRKKWMFYI